VIAFSAVKVIALSKAKEITALKFNQEDDSDRTEIKKVNGKRKKLAV
jgi:hypothetical protein